MVEMAEDPRLRRDRPRRHRAAADEVIE